MGTEDNIREPNCYIMLVLLTCVFGVLLLSLTIQVNQYETETYNAIHQCELTVPDNKHCEYRITAETVDNNKQEHM